MPRLALFGAAHIHTPGFLDTLVRRGFEVPFVVDHDAERAGRRAEKLPGARSVTVDEVEGVDGVVITSETDRHEPYVEAALALRVPLFVEKPLGFGGEDAVRMAAAIEAAGVPFSTGYFTRGQGWARTIRRMVEEGQFGQITRVRASNCHSGALGRWFDTEWRWMADPKVAGVGAFGDLGTHMLDLLLWIFGPLERVTGQLSFGTGAYEGCDETGEALLRFRSGVIGTLAAGWDDVANPVPFLVSGTKAHAVVVDGELHVTPAEARREAGERVSAGFDAWLDAVEGKPAELVTAREAAERSVAMEAIYRGAERNEWVSL